MSFLTVSFKRPCAPPSFFMEHCHQHMHEPRKTGQAGPSEAVLDQPVHLATNRRVSPAKPRATSLSSIRLDDKQNHELNKLSLFWDSKFWCGLFYSKSYFISHCVILPALHWYIKAGFHPFCLLSWTVLKYFPDGHSSSWECEASRCSLNGRINLVSTWGRNSVI